MGRRPLSVANAFEFEFEFEFESKKPLELAPKGLIFKKFDLKDLDPKDFDLKAFDPKKVAFRFQI